MAAKTSNHDVRRTPKRSADPAALPRTAGPSTSHRPRPRGTVSGLAPLPRRTLALYGAPLVGVYFAMVLFIAYISKYATDVLLMAPAVVGLIFGVGRLWDAFTDPVAGYLSDRTRLRLGRRPFSLP